MKILINFLSKSSNFKISRNLKKLGLIFMKTELGGEEEDTQEEDKVSEFARITMCQS